MERRNGAALMAHYGCQGQQRKRLLREQLSTRVAVQGVARVLQGTQDHLWKRDRSIRWRHRKVREKGFQKKHTQMASEPESAWIPLCC